jgi:hypothetical protein
MKSKKQKYKKYWSIKSKPRTWHGSMARAWSDSRFWSWPGSWSRSWSMDRAWPGLNGK